MSPEKFNVTTEIVERLISEQFPHWSNEVVKPVDKGGWDNGTFHLGDDKLIRLPSAEYYVAQVAKEQTWLPKLAPQLPLPIPTPLAQGSANSEYPWPWSIYNWIDGAPANEQNITDMDQFADDLAGFMKVLQQASTDDAPPAGQHNFFRGGDFSIYEKQSRHSIEALEDRIDGEAMTQIIDDAVASSFDDTPVWVHGDIAPGNLLVKDGQLSAVLDFGCCAIGDPACDLVITWTFFTGSARDAFRNAFDSDQATWQRARGWACWKAMLVLQNPDATNAPEAVNSMRVVEDVIAER